MEIGITVDVVRAGLEIREIELDLEHRATGKTIGGFAHRARQLRDFTRRLQAEAQGVGCARDPRDRPGDDGLDMPGLRRRWADRRPQLQRVPPALPGAGLGRARRGRDLGRHPPGRGRGDRRRRNPGGGAGRDRHHQPARDGRRLGPRHGRARPQRAGLAGPQDRGALRRASRRGPRGPGPRAHRPGAGPVLLRHQDRVAAAQLRGGPRSRRVRDDRLVAGLQAHRPPRHRPLERLAHAPLRHP